MAHADKPPVIDGDLSDPAWQHATHAVGFHRFGGSSPVSEQTEAWICADRDFLYIAFHCIDSEPQRIQASQTQRGADLGADDHVAIDIDSQGTRHDVSTFVVSAGGTQTEYLEGGTADNITWSGDWKAATRRTPDGWVAELAIPFRLLRYPKGTRSFGLFLYRRLARETNQEIWPYVPPEGNGNTLAYMNDFAGIEPTFYAPHPTILPYVLASGGSGSTTEQTGVDIKYPITTTMTALATVNPDFRTIEQDVASINFSYNPQYVDDHRPFFAEGRGYLPGSDIYYTRSISNVDEGIKVVGKDGNNAIGILGENASGPTDGQQSAAFRLQHDIGLYSNAGFTVVGDNQVGLLSNRIVRGFGDWGGQALTSWHWDVYERHTQTWQGNHRTGDENNFTLNWYGTKPGMPQFRLTQADLAPDFISNLGLIYDPNRTGYETEISQGNQFDKGKIESYFFDANAATYNRYDGTGFFRDDLSLFSRVQNRRGYAATLWLDNGHRRDDPGGETFHDHQFQPGIAWNQHSTFSAGDLSYSIGDQDGQVYRFLVADQGVPVSRAASLYFTYAHQLLGTVTTSQLIATGTYRLSNLRSLSARLVRQEGPGNDANGGSPPGTNLFFSYSQRSRHGADLYVILGDPNAISTATLITVKLLRPY